MKTLCIDARFWGIQHTGIGRYVENLIANLPKDPSIEVVLLVDTKDQYRPALLPFKKYLTHYHPYSFRAQIELNALLYRIHPDLLHSTHFTIPIFWFGKKIVTIHDLIKHISTGKNTTTKAPLFYAFKHIVYQCLVWYAVKSSNHIITPTNYWKTELMKKYNISSTKISVTYEGVSKL